MKHCETCSCDKGPPEYPVKCPKCEVTYGPGGMVATHRIDGEACRNWQKAREGMYEK